MEYVLSKNTNVIALVHHIKSGIKIGVASDDQSNNCFEIVDYWRSRMYFVIKETYSHNDQHHGKWSMNQLYYQVSFVGYNSLIKPY